MTTGIARAKRLVPEWGKVGARHAVRAYGVATAAHRPLPDYLIIGTKRGGTTSLWRILQQHPQVMPMFPSSQTLKSPHFFDIHWHRGEGWYRSHFPTDASRQRVADRVGLPVAVGDASPYYMFHPLAATRVATTIPQARLIVMLRNPTERAYSHYQERRKAGTEKLDFRSALAAETDRLAGEEERIREFPDYYSVRHDFCSYLARGRYLEHLEPWLKRFPAEQLLVVRSEDFYSRPEFVLEQIHRFLGLSAISQTRRLEHLNELAVPDMNQATRDWLDDYFSPHVAALEARLGRLFDWLP